MTGVRESNISPKWLAWLAVTVQYAALLTYLTSTSWHVRGESSSTRCLGSKVLKVWGVRGMAWIRGLITSTHHILVRSPAGLERRSDADAVSRAAASLIRHSRGLSTRFPFVKHTIVMVVSAIREKLLLHDPSTLP